MGAHLGQSVKPRYTPPPKAHLSRLEQAACGDASIARIVVGLFDGILGSRDPALLPAYDPAISDSLTLPGLLRSSARRLLEWGSKRGIVLNDLIGARQNVATAIYRMRRHSPYGRRRIRIANEIRAKFPALKPDGRARPPNLQTLEILGDEIGRPLGYGTIRRILAFGPSQIEIRRHREPWYSAWADRGVYVDLLPDGYSIARTTYVGNVEPAPRSSVITGVLEDFFETGTEGVVWSVYDEDERGYDGLHTIAEGDYLTILDQLGRRRWAGQIRCDRQSGWKEYPLNPGYGQPVALGHYVHWTQKGFKPDEWARFFIRPNHDRLRAILRRKPSKTAPPA